MQKINSKRINQAIYAYRAAVTTAIVIFILLMPTHAYAAGQVYYVSTTGSDANGGSYSDPFGTPAKAFSIAEAGDVINIEPGTYSISSTIYPSNAGTSSARITVQKDPYASGDVVFQGSASQPFIRFTKRYWTLKDIHFDITGGSATTNLPGIIETGDGTGSGQNLGNYLQLYNLYADGHNYEVKAFFANSNVSSGSNAWAEGFDFDGITVVNFGSSSIANCRGMFLNRVRNSAFKNLNFTTHGDAIRFWSSTNNVFRDCMFNARSSIGNHADGFDLCGSYSNKFYNIGVFNTDPNAYNTLIYNDGRGSNDNNYWYNCHFVSNHNYALNIGAAPTGAFFYNSVFYGASGLCYAHQSGTTGTSYIYLYNCISLNSKITNGSSASVVGRGGYNWFVGSVPGWSSHSWSGDPGMTNPSTSATTKGEFDLTSTSPCINIGETPSMDSNVPTFDYRNVIRDAATDIGPYEYGATDLSASFTTQTSKANGYTVVFDASGSTAASGTTIVSYTMNFGDGTPAIQQAKPLFEHTYAAAGTYLVVLTVTDSTGNSASTTHSIRVKKQQGQKAARSKAAMII